VATEELRPEEMVPIAVCELTDELEMEGIDWILLLGQE
jgi:hypothetical protein